MSKRSSRTTTSAATGLLLVYEVRIDDARKALFIALRQHTPQFTPSSNDAAGHDERSIAKIDEAHFATIIDPPPVP